MEFLFPEIVTSITGSGDKLSDAGIVNVSS